MDRHDFDTRHLPLVSYCCSSSIITKGFKYQNEIVFDIYYTNISWTLSTVCDIFDIQILSETRSISITKRRVKGSCLVLSPRRSYVDDIQRSQSLEKKLLVPFCLIEISQLSMSVIVSWQSVAYILNKILICISPTVLSVFILVKADMWTLSIINQNLDHIQNFFPQH